MKKLFTVAIACMMALGASAQFYIYLSDGSVLEADSISTVSPYLGFDQGALPGLFSLSATKQVQFSTGNLQYQASTDIWRFAEHQYDMIGDDNKNISSSYSGWIDLFGWGTGNNPTNASQDETDYATFTDWGVNPISNGGNKANQWRTLTYDEWEYLLEKRPDAKNKYGVAQVNGVNGLIILPDIWTLPSGCSFTAGVAIDSGPEYFVTVNSYTAFEWTKMESAGALFLPAAGSRFGTDVCEVYYNGNYCSATPYDENFVYSIMYGSNFVSVKSGFHNGGISVRLVYDLP